MRSVVQWLLGRLLGKEDARALLSELQEQFEDHRRAHGEAHARKTHRREIRRALMLAAWARIRAEPPSTASGLSRRGIRGPGSPFLDGLLRDLRFGVRSLRRRPLFAVLAVLTLGLGIGSATAIFSVVEGVLLRPLPYLRPHELVAFHQAVPSWQEIEALAGGWDRVPLNQPAFQHIREGQTSFTEVAAYRTFTGTLVGEDEVTLVLVGVGSSTLFSVLGVSPLMGRTFSPSDDGPAARQVTLISQESWEGLFGSDPDILGKQVNLSGESYTVIGVLPAGINLLRGLSPSSETALCGFWLPMGQEAERFRVGSDMYYGIARLRSGVTRSRAEEEVTALIRSDPIALGYDYVGKVRDLTTEWTGAYRRPLGILLGASLILLLIACGNVAALLLGEAPGRRREMTTRRALGAGSRRLGQQLLTECLLLGAAGSVVGVGVSRLVSRLLLGLAPPIHRLDQVGLNGWVLSFSLAAGVLTSLVFGLAPVLQVIRGGGSDMVGAGNRVRGLHGALLHRTVVSVEIALTVLLLVGGGLLAKTFFTLLDVDTGFRQEGLIEARVSIPSYLTDGSGERARLYEEMVEAVQALPGVLRVSGTSSLPFSGSMSRNAITLYGGPEPVGALAQRRLAYAGFFRTMGIPVLRGREFTEADGQNTPRVAVISREMADRFWPGENPIGTRFLTIRDTVEVVGIVGDVRHSSLRTEPRPTFYVAAAQQAEPPTMSLVARTDRDPRTLLPQVRGAIRRVHPTAPITRLEPAESFVYDSARDERFRAYLILLFGAVAILLAGTGIFGVTARGVEARRGEMGVRMALGAEDGHLLRLAVIPSLVSGLAGVGVGLAGALGASRVLAAFLFGVEPWDPATYAFVALMVLVVSLMAAWFPSRRIKALDPATVLRME